MVQVIDEQENVWPLRSLVAKILSGLQKGEFSAAQMAYIEDFSK